jgi:hypothetical protein
MAGWFPFKDQYWGELLMMFLSMFSIVPGGKFVVFTGVTGGLVSLVTGRR